MWWALTPAVVRAALAVWNETSGQLEADQLAWWKLAKGQVRQAIGLNNARLNTRQWLAPIQPHLQLLAAASSAGTSLEANRQHITTTLATWDALEEEIAEVSTKRHKRVKQLVVFFAAAGIGTGGGWGADAVLRACCKVVCRPRGTDQRRFRVVLVDEHRTSRPSCNSQAATQAAASEPQPSTPPPAKRSKHMEQAAASTQPTKGTGEGKGKADKAKPGRQPGRGLARYCNASLHIQRIGESRWRPLELRWWSDLQASARMAFKGPAAASAACDTVLCQQTAPTMSRRDMQHQAAVDGGASATDGYSPAGEAPPPATRLLDLPPELQDGIACRVMQLGARNLLPLTSRAFSQASLLHAPALRIQLGRQRCDQLLTPRVVAALQARTSKLTLTLWQPETEDSTRYRKQLAPTLQLLQTECTQDYTDLLAHALAKLDNCASVEVCKLVSSGTYDLNSYRHLRCSPGLAQHLLDSFPSLTALTLEGLCVSSAALASLLSHPPLALQLQQLDIAYIISQDVDEPGAVGTLFQGLQLKQLSIAPVHPRQPGTPPLPSFQPLAQHLTQLHIMNQCERAANLGYFMEYLQPLVQLQVLTISHLDGLEGLAELLQALPQLHTLQLPAVRVRRQQELCTLLAATQLTSVQLGTVEALRTSYAATPCSWQRLKLTWDWEGQQTVPAMSQRDMQHQVTVDGSASATDGYSPASEAPTPATRLLDLPPALLDDIACRVMQLGARSQLPLTCHAFSQARLMHFPALRIQLGRQRCDQLLTPRVVAALQARTSKLALTLWQPETDDSEGYRKQLAPTLQLPQTEDTQDYTELLTHALAKLDNCTAVEVCRLVSCGTYRSDKRKHLRCPPGLTQQLLDSFPSLTALTLEGLSVSSDALASLLSHPPLALQLQQLHLTNDSVPNGEVPKSVGLAFQGLRLKQLSIDAIRPEPGTPPLPSFQSLAQHLTQLHLMIGCVCRTYLSFYREYLQPLAQLQVLTISNLYTLNGLTEVLQALPQLHTLQLPDVTVRGQQELNTLLAATQITSLHLRQVKALDTSYADAPCSWQRLELTAIIQRKVLAYLPLHSLSQLLVLGRFAISVEDIPDPEVAGALHLLTEAIKVPVQIKEVELRMRIPYEVITPALLQQQRVDLEHLISLLQPLQCCCVDKVEVRGLDRVTAADVLALAPLCRDCTYFELDGGSVEPSLEFWRQLVQLMPTVQEVIFYHVEGSISAAMHESLQLMAEQPWARWLDVTIFDRFTPSEMPACWQAGSWVKAGIFKLHTLQLPGATVREQDLGTLLAATRITNVQFGILHGLHAPRADAPCISAACLPLHSLIQNVQLLCIVSNLIAASAANVPALAPLCQACTRLRFHSSAACAPIDFWQQLVQLMPTVQQVTFWSVEGAANEAMCEPLRLMAVLDIRLLATASSAGTSLEASLKYIIVTLTTWDAVWEVYLYLDSTRGWRRSMERHKRVKQLVVFFGAAGIGNRGGWGAVGVLRACCKVVYRPRGTDQQRGRVVLVNEFRTSRPGRHTASSLRARAPPGKRSKRTMAVQAAEPTQPNKGTGEGKGKVAKAKPTPQPGKWLNRDCNAALNMQRIGESRWRPLELCWWLNQAALQAKARDYPGLGYKRLRGKPRKTQQQPVEAP
ncbi:hypothetical protein QJQ45_001204 [Haematococcus lacustris]|nr:hypothetical protein QJQ45_001204 [Haematococcus lacustris]